MSNLKLSESLKDLYIVSGRAQGEDDDDVHIVQARDLGHAVEKFIQTLQDSIDPDDYDEFADDDGPHVYLMVNNSLEDAVNNRIVADDANRTLDMNVLRNLYLISGRVSGDDEDAAHIVEANDLSDAIQAFEDHMKNEHGELRGYSQRETEKLEVVVVEDKTLISAIQERLIDDSPKNDVSNDGVSPAF